MELLIAALLAALLDVAALRWGVDSRPGITDDRGQRPNCGSSM